jgi:hypothetical protein
MYALRDMMTNGVEFCLQVEKKNEWKTKLNSVRPIRTGRINKWPNISPRLPSCQTQINTPKHCLPRSAALPCAYPPYRRTDVHRALSKDIQNCHWLISVYNLYAFVHFYVWFSVRTILLNVIYPRPQCCLQYCHLFWSPHLPHLAPINFRWLQTWH